MSEEETLALDAMRADNIIDIEQRQTYLALTEALEGDYMSGEEHSPGRIDVGPLPEGYKETFQYGEGVGVVGVTPTSGRQQAIAEAEVPNRGERMKQIAYEITGIAGRLRPGPEANRLYDLAFEIDQLFLNQK